MIDENIEDIIIPDISVNYNIKINSLYFITRKKSNDKKKELKYLKQDFTLFACLTYPYCNKEKIRNISDFYFWHIKYCLDINILEYKSEFEELLILFDDYISISNDILSFKKEYIDGDMNIVIIIHKYYNYSIQRSIDESFKLLNNILTQFNEISNKLSNKNKDLKKIILAMKYWIFNVDKKII